MNAKQRTGLTKSPPYRKGRPISSFSDLNAEKTLTTVYLQPVQEKYQAERNHVESSHAESVQDERNRADNDEGAQESFDSQAFKSEVERFIEISKYFSSPLRKTASYLSEQTLVSYPSSFRVEYKRGGVITEHIKFSNLVLEPIYVKLYKVIPDLEQIKFINLSLSRCKRIPPGLSFNLGFVYDDVNEKPSVNAKMIFVASRKTTTPCYQVCEIEVMIEAQKNRRFVTA